MKLIDILVQELPKRGGWPEGVARLAQDPDGDLQKLSNRDAWFMSIAGWTGDGREDFFGEYIKNMNIIAEDHATAIVTRGQYEAALKQSVWDGTGLPPVGVECEVSVDGGRTWCSYKAINERNGVRLIEVGNFTEEFMVNNWAFRPIRTERDEAVHTIADLCRSAASNGHSADLIYNAIAEGKIPGIKLEKE